MSLHKRAHRPARVFLTMATASLLLALVPAVAAAPPAAATAAAEPGWHGVATVNYGASTEFSGYSAEASFVLAQSVATSEAGGPIPLDVTVAKWVAHDYLVSQPPPTIANCRTDEFMGDGSGGWDDIQSVGGLLPKGFQATSGGSEATAFTAGAMLFPVRRVGVSIGPWPLCTETPFTQDYVVGTVLPLDGPDVNADPCRHVSTFSVEGQTTKFNMTYTPYPDEVIEGCTAADDSDRDGLADDTDNCPTTFNSDQTDTNGNGIGDVCDGTDSDGDGALDSVDVCPDTPAGALVNEVGCQDSDGDGVADNLDQCPATPSGSTVDAVGCPDSDGDGVSDSVDDCPTAPGPAANAGCPTVAWDWSVKPRMFDANGDGMHDYKYVRGLLTKALEPNQRLSVILDACPATSVTWSVNGSPIGSGCQIVTLLPEGSYTVTASRPDGSVTTKTINPKHFLIVGMGDSYGSGEGAPVKKPDAYRRDSPDWDNRACHRSRYSAQARAAMALEKSSPKSAVTFLHVACSGAKSATGIYGPQVNPPGAAGTTVIPQVSRVRQEVLGNEVDAVLLSIGGNDILFSDIIKACITKLDCPLSYTTFSGSTLLHTRTQRLLAALSAKLATVQACLGLGGGSCPVTPLHVAPKRVLHTEYPSLGQRESGSWCGAAEPAITTSEFRWATSVVELGRAGTIYKYRGKYPIPVTANGLNRQILAGATRNFTPVTGIFDASVTHGYCALNTWVQSLLKSTYNQGDINGAFHPNYAGQKAFGRIIGAKLIATLN